MKKEMSATLFDHEWDLIATALGQRPYIEVANLLSKLASQLQSQKAPPTPTPQANQGET